MIHLTLAQVPGEPDQRRIRINPDHIISYRLTAHGVGSSIHLAGVEDMVIVMENPDDIDELLEDK